MKSTATGMVVVQIPSPLIFVRHGETDWNNQRRFQGNRDVPLNATGHQQAMMNAQIASDLSSSGTLSADDWRIVSSPLSRALETAQEIAVKLGVTVHQDNRLCEVGWGRWEGLTSQEIKNRYYEERKARKVDPWRFAPQGGESLEQRSTGLGTLLTGEKPGTILVTHSGIIRIVFHLLGGLDRLEAATAGVPHEGLWLWDGKILDHRVDGS